MFSTVITKKEVLLSWRRQTNVWMRCTGRYNLIICIYWSIIKSANYNWKMYYFFPHNSPGQKPSKVSPKQSLFFTDKCSLFSRGPLGDCWQSWELTQVQIHFCSMQIENLCFCFNLQESVLGLLVFFHISEKKIQKHMMLPGTVSLRNVNACGYCLSVDNMLLWICICLSSGRDLIELFHI